MTSSELRIAKLNRSNAPSFASATFARSLAVPRSSRVLPFDFSCALNRGDIAFSISQEIEATYFAPRSVTLPLIRSYPEERARISQAYFTKEVRDELLRELQWASSSHALSSALAEVKSARVRRIERNGELSFCLDLKGPKQGPDDARITRMEISLKLDSFAYRKLRAHATRGGVEKTRLYIDGTVEPKGGKKVHIKAEVDHFERIGPLENGRPRDVVARSFDFALIDLELPHRSLLRTLRAGRHSFDFLANSIDIALLPDHMQKHFSAQRLASLGITEDIVWARKKIARRLEEGAA